MAQPAQKETLCEQIRRIRNDAETTIMNRAVELKNGQDGRTLPLESLRQMLAKGDDCPCRIALRLLEEKNG